MGLRKKLSHKLTGQFPGQRRCQEKKKCDNALCSCEQRKGEEQEETRKISEKTLLQCHFVHDVSYMKSHEIEPEAPRRAASV
jgi:hypothetical protein